MLTDPDYWLPNGLARHTLPKPPGLVHVDTLLDVGAGLRPMQWYVPKKHICLEPYDAYADKLEIAGYEVIREIADENMIEADAIYLLDVIEHMEKDEGLRVVEQAVALARRQIVMYTPVGFMPQEVDAWGLGGHYWQTHRSGWLPEDFEGWTIERQGKGFFAVLTK